MDWAAKFDEGVSYEDFLKTYGTEEQRRRWTALAEQIQLTDSQRGLLASFQREMIVVCLAGAWCGDCVNQCPILQAFAVETPKIRLRFFDRDAHPDLGARLSICGAPRVPAVLFLSEDWHPCGLYGDRTLSRYREVAATQLGASCPTGLVGPSGHSLAAWTQDWLNEFERIQLMLRTSGRLRQLHGD